MELDIEIIDLPASLNLKSFCRFCGEQDKMYPIKDLEELNINLIGLLSFLELHIEFNQYLSELVCSSCLRQISEISKFKIQCKSAEERMITGLRIPIKTEEIKVELIDTNPDPDESFKLEDSDNENGLEIDNDNSDDSEYKPSEKRKRSHENHKNFKKCSESDNPIEQDNLSTIKKHKTTNKKSKQDKNKSTVCLTCNKSFPTYRGLSNHKLAHRRRDVEGFKPKKRPECQCGKFKSLRLKVNFHLKISYF